MLKTPRSVVTANIANGTYIYLGVKQGIIRTLRSKQYSGDVIKLIINIDGLPLYKSSSTTAWPILGMFGDMDPFIIALYCGKGKPTDLNAYLRDFCDEAEILKLNGIGCNGVLYSVLVWLFVCDACDARAFLKCIKGHQGYHACERCVMVDEYQGRIVFHDGDAGVRTDGSFSALEYEEHQNNRSILIDYGHVCVTGFVLDYMHLVLLGVVKRSLKCFNKWTLTV